MNSSQISRKALSSTVKVTALVAVSTMTGFESTNFLSPVFAHAFHDPRRERHSSKGDTKGAVVCNRINLPPQFGGLLGMGMHHGSNYPGLDMFTNNTFCVPVAKDQELERRYQAAQMEKMEKKQEEAEILLRQQLELEEEEKRVRKICITNCEDDNIMDMDSYNITEERDIEEEDVDSSDNIHDHGFDKGVEDFQNEMSNDFADSEENHFDDIIKHLSEQSEEEFPFGFEFSSLSDDDSELFEHLQMMEQRLREVLVSSQERQDHDLDDSELFEHLSDEEVAQQLEEMFAGFMGSSDDSHASK